MSSLTGFREYWLFRRTCRCAGGLLIPSLLRWRPPPVPLIAAGIATWFLFPHWSDTINQARWLFGIGGTLLVAGFVALSIRNPQSGNTPLGRWAARSGDYSYALYLCSCAADLYSLHPAARRCARNEVDRPRSARRYC